MATVGDQIVVTNTRGIDARGPKLTFNKGPGTTPATGHGTHGTTASLTRFTLPSDRDIAQRYTDDGLRPERLGQATTSSRPRAGKAAPVPVPTRIGDPSTIKHVFLLVKENRTYDQVYGDMPEGNGDPSLAQFGEQVTPNQHALARQFGLYDNTYDVGTNSAEGHNWLMQGDNPEYTESSAGRVHRAATTPRRTCSATSAPASSGRPSRTPATPRATTASSSTPRASRPATWQQYYCAAKSVEAGGDPAQLTTPELKGNYGSVIPSLNAITNPTRRRSTSSIPDVYRYQIWKQDFEKNGPADFNMVWLSSDHTGGPATRRRRSPTATSRSARSSTTISHSKYWKDSAIFVVEDDSQDGADHVDGHRAPIQVISPWARSTATVDSTLLLADHHGAHDRADPRRPAAEPEARRGDADVRRVHRQAGLHAVHAVPNQIPLTESVATPPACGPDTPGPSATSRAQAARAAGRHAVPADEVAVAAAWQTWLGKQHTAGKSAIPDYANPEQMNRYTWYQTHNWKVPYPGDPKIYLPSKVPGAFIPSPDTN